MDDGIKVNPCGYKGTQAVCQIDIQQKLIYITLNSHKQLETHGCVLSAMITDAPVLKQQDIRIYDTDHVSVVLVQYQTNLSHLQRTTQREMKWHFGNKYPGV